MGNPKNRESEGCVATSSNCVIWQGPDISFLKLCTGDSISIVMKKMADKICSLIKTTSPGSYDLSCISESNCGPKDFVELIQLLIDTVCVLKQASTSLNENSPNTLETELAVATCFQEAGAVQPLDDYVSAIGVKLCNLITLVNSQQGQIASLNSTVSNLQDQITAIT